jgi:hypothetical protein
VIELSREQLKKRFRQNYDNNRGWYYTDGLPVADPQQVISVTDDKMLFEWSAKLTLQAFKDSKTLQYLDVEMYPSNPLPEHVSISMVEIWKSVCDNSEKLSYSTCGDLVWKSSNVFKLSSLHSAECSTEKVKIILKADVNMRKPLETFMSKRVFDLFENGKHTDVVLTVKGEKFKAHKALLMEKSPVFEAMVRKRINSAQNLARNAPKITILNLKLVLNLRFEVMGRKCLEICSFR